MRRLVIGSVLLLTACAPAPAPSARPSVSGTITLPEAAMIEVIGPGDDAQHLDCQGAGDFEDLVVGSQVIAHDGSGAVVGTGQVAVGEAEADKGSSPSQPARAIPPCVLPFEIAVQAADFYTFNIAGWPVELVYSREDLAALGWKLDLAPTD